MIMPPALNSLIIYARDVTKTATFYQRYFGYLLAPDQTDGMVALVSPAGGARLAIHQAAKSVKLGQVGVKLTFDVRDVEAFKAAAAARGLKFGSTHQGDGYTFANAKDPDKNSVSISSRAFRKTTSTT
jgi:predicted enzyme related to lactoylglutathione lyase